MVVIARIWSEENQEPGTIFDFLTCLARVFVLGPTFVTFCDALGRGWIEL